jgi:hypothetical protein
LKIKKSGRRTRPFHRGYLGAVTSRTPAAATAS